MRVKGRGGSQSDMIHLNIPEIEHLWVICIPRNNVGSAGLIWNGGEDR